MKVDKKIKMKYIVTDKIGHKMTLDTSEKLKAIELGTYEERFPFENKLVFCYKRGTFQDCKVFLDKQDKDIKECLEIKEISDD